MKLTWYGHDAFLIEGPPSVLIDPFFSANPKAGSDLIKRVACDFIVLTHGHGDHLGDTIAIGKRTGATVFATHEIATWCREMGGLKAEGMNTGGTLPMTDAAGKTARVTMVPAHHSCSIQEPDGTVRPGGVSVGVIIEAGGKAIYHLGDTGLLRDFKTIGEFWEIDVALIPMGDRFTMGPESATIAAGWIRPRKVIPMHYNTFPLIEQDPHAYARLVEERHNIPVEVMEPGQTVEL